MESVPDLVIEMNRLIAAARQQKSNCARSVAWPSSFTARIIRVFSIAIPRMWISSFLENSGSKLESFFQSMGYFPNKQFNLLNGALVRFIIRRAEGVISIFWSAISRCVTNCRWMIALRH